MVIPELAADLQRFITVDEVATVSQNGISKLNPAMEFGEEKNLCCPMEDNLRAYFYIYLYLLYPGVGRRKT